MDVTLPNGVVIEGIPEGTSKEEIRIKAIRSGLATSADFKPSMPKAKAKPQGGSIADAAGQGLALGWSDELAGALGATYGILAPESLGGLPEGIGWKEAYQGISGAARSNAEAFAERNPATAVGAELAGGLLTGGVGAARAATANAARGLVPKYMRYAGAGAGVGGIAGAGSADPGDTLSGAVTGGVMGGALGAAVPAIGGVIGAGVRKGAESLGVNAGSAIDRKVLEAMRRDGLTTEQINRKLAQYGDDATLADVGGANIKGLARAATAFPGKAKSQADRVLNSRQMRQNKRVRGALEDNLTSDTDYYGYMDDLIAATRAKSKPAYDLAYSKDIPLTDNLKGLLGRKSVAKAWKNAQGIANDEGVELPKVFKLNDAGDKVVDIIDSPDMRTWDYIKRGLDDVVDKNTDDFGKVRGNKGYAVDQLRRGLLKELDELNPDYSSARSAYAGGARMRGAMERGKKLFTEDADMTVRGIQKMGDSEKDAFRVGMSKALRDRIANAPDGSDAYKRIFGNENIRKKIEAAFPDSKSYHQFKAQMLKEKRFYETRNTVLGGSPTARIEAEKLDSVVDPSVLSDAVTGNWRGILSSGAKKAMSGLSMPSEALRTNAADMMLTPGNQSAVVQRLMSSGLLNDQQKLMLMRKGLMTGGGAASVPGLMY